MLSNLTDEGRKTVKMRPERIKEVNDEIEKITKRINEVRQKKSILLTTLRNLFLSDIFMSISGIRINLNYTAN